jgi:hypothetical protein
VYWSTSRDPEGVTGTSAGGPYAGGVLAALNRRYGSYLTREQILFAVIAACDPVTHVTAFGNQTPQDIDIEYHKNGAGLLYNAEYGGFGLLNPHKADHILGHMVALTQAAPESITVPTEVRVEIDTNSGEPFHHSDGLYHYDVVMPPGYALKTTVEVEFVKNQGAVSLTSPSHTTFPVAVSWTQANGVRYGIGTSHAWTGENLGGIWRISSTQPIKRLRLNQHHFLEGDVVHNLDIAGLLQTSVPDLSNAVPLTELRPIRRELHTRTVDPDVVWLDAARKLEELTM